MSHDLDSLPANRHGLWGEANAGLGRSYRLVRTVIVG